VEDGMMQWFLNLSVRAKVSVGMGLMVLCLGIVIFSAYTSIKSIEQSQTGLTEYLKETARVADSIAGGDLRVSVKPQSDKDVLGNAFAMMVQRLRRTTTEFAEGANVLASSASEILVATTQVASGVAETATAISETTTTVEEVRQTGHISSQKAKNVLESSQKATEEWSSIKFEPAWNSIGGNWMSCQVHYEKRYRL
jgi:methyl-accepting chemotaxis protein